MNPYLNIDLGITSLTYLYRRFILSSENWEVNVKNPVPWPETEPISSIKPVLNAAFKDEPHWVTGWNYFQDTKHRLPVLAAKVEIRFNDDPIGYEVDLVKALYNDHGLIDYKEGTPWVSPVNVQSWWVDIWNNMFWDEKSPVEKIDKLWLRATPVPPDDVLWAILFPGLRGNIYPMRSGTTIFYPWQDTKFGLGLYRGKPVIGLASIPEKIFREPTEAVEAAIQHHNLNINNEEKLIIINKLLSLLDEFTFKYLELKREHGKGPTHF